MAASNNSAPKKFVACPIMLAMTVGIAVVIRKPVISRSSTTFPYKTFPSESKCTLNKLYLLLSYGLNVVCVMCIYVDRKSAICQFGY